MRKTRSTGRYLRLRESGLTRAKQAFQRLALSCEEFAALIAAEEGRAISRHPVERFLRGEPVERDNFRAFCLKLDIPISLAQDEGGPQKEEFLLPANSPHGLPPWLHPLRFTAFLHEKRRGFVGRDWLIQRIEHWLSSCRPGFALLVADPGAGKSALAARLTAHPACYAYHFCLADTEQSLNPGRFVHSLAATLALRLPAFAERLGEAAIEEALRMPTASNEPGTAIEVGLLDALASIEPMPARGFIVVDGLDEALLRSGSTIVDVLASRLHRLPLWLGIIATTRPEPAILTALAGVPVFPITPEDPLNLADIRHYLGVRLEQRGVEQSIDTATLVLEKSCGNFLWATQALDQMEVGEGVDDLSALPPGMGALYHRFFTRQFKDQEEFSRARNLLEVVLAAACPLDEKQLAQASGLDPDDELPLLLRRLAVYLPPRIEVDGRETFALFHYSLAEWLTCRDNRGSHYYCSIARGHRLLSTILSRNDRTTLNTWSNYLASYAPLHFLAAESFEVLLQQILSWPELLIATTADTLATSLSGPDPQRMRANQAITHFAVHAPSSTEAFQVLVETAFNLADRDRLDLAREVTCTAHPRSGQLELALDMRCAARKNQVVQVCTLAEKLLQCDTLSDGLAALAHFHLAEVHRIRGHHREAMTDYRRAVDAVQPQVNLRVWMDAGCALADLEYVRGNLAGAEERLTLLQQAITANPGTPTFYRARIHRLYGQIYHMRGQWSEARADFEESLVLLRQLRHFPGIIEGLNSLALLLIQVDPEAVRALLLEARELARQHDARLEYGKTYSVEAEWHLSRQEFEPAFACANEALHLMQEVGYGSGLARARTLLASIVLNHYPEQHAQGLELALMALRYYMDEEIYPSLRLEAYCLVMQSARRLGVPDRYADLDDPAVIPCIEQFPGCQVT